jgi:hypothetical protein
MRVHLISTATALALGYAAGFASDGLVAQAAKSVDHKEVVSLDVANDHPAIVAIWEKVEQATCNLADAQAGFDAGTCALVPGSAVSLRRGETSTHVSAAHIYPGTFSPGIAQ